LIARRALFIHLREYRGPGPARPWLESLVTVGGARFCQSDTLNVCRIANAILGIGGSPPRTKERRGPSSTCASPRCPPDRGQIYINEYWRDRVSNVNLKIFAFLPPGPVTLASLAQPSLVCRGIDLDVAANRVFSLCHLFIQQIMPALGASANVPPTAAVAATTAAGGAQAAQLAGVISITAPGQAACPPSDLVCSVRAL
jgi:hypothetical protein